MIDEGVQNARRLRNAAQGRRREARECRIGSPERDRLLAEAANSLQDAIEDLERRLRTVRRTTTQHTVDLCRILQALSQTYGSLGATRRDARDYRAAAEHYDRGNAYEAERRLGCRRFVYDDEILGHDTYNMLQRLIVRLLDHPSLLREPDFIADLNAVSDELRQEVSEGRNDSWGLADLALCLFLSGTHEERAIDSVSSNWALADAMSLRIESSQAQPTFYESTYHVVEALIEEGLGKGEMLGERLKRFSQLLQRKGGFAKRADEAR